MLQVIPPHVYSKVFITEELNQRPIDRADFLKEKIALQELASRMISDPDAVLPRFVELAMQMTGGGSAGLSIRDEPQAVFRWLHLCGELSAFEGATTPRGYSPCGVTLDKLEPTLVRHPEWAYSWVADANIELPEVLLVPLSIGGSEPIGTLWIAATKEGHFHSEHARVASELATFVGIAMHVKRGEERIRHALEAQETLTREMNHRVKNLFALAEGILRQTLRNSTTKEEMAEAFSGRLRALSSAHSLVLRDKSIVGDGLDLRALLKAIIDPHVNSGSAIENQIKLAGPDVQCGDKAASSLALVLNELATNSAKYGALNVDGGQLTINWLMANGKLSLNWSEFGGPPVSAPTHAGFGNKLVDLTIVRQFRGMLEYRWLPGGLEVAIEIPSDALVS